MRSKSGSAAVEMSFFPLKVGKVTTAEVSAREIHRFSPPPQQASFFHLLAEFFDRVNFLERPGAGGLFGCWTVD